MDTNLTPGVIHVAGRDAAVFLRAQLSNDVQRLSLDRHFLAAWCDAKGRTQLVMQVVAIEDAYLLLVPQALIEAALKRLRMYVLRSNVALRDATSEYDLTGALGLTKAPLVNETWAEDGTLRLGLPATIDDTSRTLCIAPTGRTPSALALDDPEWVLAEIDAGVPSAGPATQGEFVPQMLNLHWLMAIDFAKGCYPGQEVIARLHYRGRLTRRVYRLSYDGPAPDSGETLLDADGARAGTILRSAPVDDYSGRALAVVYVEKAAAPIQTEAGARLSALALPYATPE